MGVGLENQQLEPFLLYVEAGVMSQPRVTHPGQEFVYCMSGVIEYIVDGRSYLLQSGDSLLFEGRLPHCWHNPTDDVAVVLMVFQAAQDNEQAREYHLTG